MTAISLFTNCGAGDAGYAAAGFHFAVLAEKNRARLNVATLNHPKATPIAGDLRRTWREVVKVYRAQHGPEAPALLTAGPPCQGMSSARGGRGKESDPDAGARDGRNLLVLPIARVAQELRPVCVVVENVPAFLRRQLWDPATRTPQTAARMLVQRLAPEYAVYAIQMDLCEYGVPQHRARVFLAFVRRGTTAHRTLQRTRCAPFPAPTHGGESGRKYITLAAALRRAGLCELDAGSPAQAQCPREPMHCVPVWPDRRCDMVAAIPPGSGRSAWETDACRQCSTQNISPELAVCPNCTQPLLRPIIRNGSGSWRLVKGYRNSSYRRMAPDKPAATVTTASGQIGSDRTIHPWEHRVLSPAECAMLQTFPDGFLWGEAMSRCGHTGIRQMIGEAVPPRFTKHHGEVLAALMKGERIPPLLADQDPRVSKARARL